MCSLHKFHLFNSVNKIPVTSNVVCVKAEGNANKKTHRTTLKEIENAMT